MESFQSVGKSLPTKEAGLIKQVMRLIDNKKFAKALKKVDKVLLEVPDDGESLSLKGNILTCLGRKEESLQFAKQGVMKNLKGALSWHVLSQVYYNDKNYQEAYKAEQKAFNIAPTNNSVLKSLSLLQLHTRDYAAFRDSRKTILLTNFTGLINWISYAVAEYLCGALDKTSTILDSFLKSMEKHMSNQELSETLLFKGRVLGDQGRFLEMLEFLQTNKAKIKDTPTWYEYLTQAALGANNLEEANKAVLELININSENPKFFAWYFQAKGANDDPAKFALLGELKQKYPKSNAIEREQLNYLHENILEQAGEYIVKRIRKGIPSIFTDIKSLLEEQPRGQLILDFVRQNTESLNEKKAFIDVVTKEPSEKIEQPQCLMWLLYLYSQILDHYHRHEEALQVIDEAISHTPTVPDLYLFKAKILKHLNEISKAVLAANEARVLDLGDRYLNNKHAKYLLRNNQVQETEEIMGLFSKEKANELNVHDMQSMWYELELAEAHFRLNNFSKAAEEFRWIEKHFVEMFEDQYDFHFYCYRKMNLNSYVDFMAFEDTLMKHKNFLRAGLGLIKIYEKDPCVVTIAEAYRLSKLLLKNHPGNEEVNLAAFPIFMQKEKYLMSLRSLNKLKQAKEYAALREEFCKNIQGKEFKPSVQEVIQRILNLD